MQLSPHFIASRLWQIWSRVQRDRHSDLTWSSIAIRYGICFNAMAIGVLVDASLLLCMTCCSAAESIKKKPLNFQMIRRST
jgi:hypothetical protein